MNYAAQPSLAVKALPVVVNDDEVGWPGAVVGVDKERRVGCQLRMRGILGFRVSLGGQLRNATLGIRGVLVLHTHVCCCALARASPAVGPSVHARYMKGCAIAQSSRWLSDTGPGHFFC